MTRRTYANPPIEEALCELRFEPGPSWNMTIPGRFYESVADAYPGEPQEARRLEAQVSTPAAGPASFAVKDGPLLIRFPSKDGSQMVTVGPDLLSVHDLRPYSGWETFRPRIERALLAYAATAKPLGVRRIGVRYVNRVVIKSSAIDLGDYFTSSPGLPESVAAQMFGVFARTEANFDDIPARFVTTFGSAEGPPDGSSFVLDIDVIADFDENPAPIEAVMDHVDILRERERDLFEQWITDSSRELFDGH